MTTSSKRVVVVSPVLVQGAKLRKVLNDRRGLPTSPVTAKIAALAGPASSGPPAVRQPQ
jgi:hypothetical protein